MLDFLRDYWPELAALAGLLALSAGFSGSETATFVLAPEAIEGLRREHPRRADRLARLAADPAGLLAAVLFGNMLANVTFFCIAAHLALALGRGAGGAAGAVTAAVAAPLAVILGGEVLPKVVAVTYPRRTALLVALPLWGFYRAVAPVRTFLARLGAAAGGRPGGEGEEARVTAEELSLLVDLSREAGALQAGEEELLAAILRLGEMRLREIMTPRVDLVRIEAQQPPAALLELARRTTKTHVLVYEGNVDRIVGYVAVRDVLLARPAPADLRALLRPVVFLPELARVEPVLTRFLDQRLDLAVAVDEYGGTAGVVTLEDLLEAVVGEMEDEFAEAAPAGEPVRQLADGRYSLAGDLAAGDWEEVLGLDLPRARPAGPATLAGFVVGRLGRCPREGDAVVWRNLRFTVERMSRRRVARVLVELLEAAAASGTAPDAGSRAAAWDRRG